MTSKDSVYDDYNPYLSSNQYLKRDSSFNNQRRQDETDNSIFLLKSSNKNKDYHQAMPTIVNSAASSNEDYASLNVQNIFAGLTNPLFGGSNDFFALYPLDYEHSSTVSAQSEMNLCDEHHLSPSVANPIFDNVNISKVNSPPQNYLPIAFEMDTLGLSSFTNNPLFLDIPSAQQQYFDPAELSPCISIDDDNGFRPFTEISGYESLNFRTDQFTVPMEVKYDDINNPIENEILRFATDGFGIICKLSPSIFADVECRVINDGIIGDIKMKLNALDYGVTIITMNPFVAQKSYGHERRFICPTAKVVLYGNGAPKTRNIGGRLRAVKADGAEFANQKHKIYSADQPVVQSYSSSLITVEGNVEIEESTYHSISGKIEKEFVSIEFRRLYINDLERQKTFRFKYEVYDTVHQGLICKLQSNPVKVLSKPSQSSAEKLSVLNITSGSNLTLFNRVKSQSGTTRFLTRSEETLSCNGNLWDAFTVWNISEIKDILDKIDVNLSNISEKDFFLLLPDEKQRMLNYYTLNLPRKTGRTLEYGTKVLFQHYETGKLTIPFVIHRLQDNESRGESSRKKGKTDRTFYTKLMDNSLQTISQMHRVVLQVDGKTGVYLSLNDEKVELYYAEISGSDFIPGPSNPYCNLDIQLNDKCVWTIVMIDIERNILQINLNIPLTDTYNFISLPRITGIKERQKHCLSIIGENFRSGMSIFFGVVPVKKLVYESEQKIFVEMLPGLTVKNQKNQVSDFNKIEKVPVLIVQRDGLIIQTGFFVLLSLA